MSFSELVPGWWYVCREALCWLIVVVKAHLVPSVSYYPLCLLLDDGVVHNWVLFRVPFGLRLFLGVLAISAVGSVVDLGVVFFWLAIFPPSVMLSEQNRTT